MKLRWGTALFLACVANIALAQTTVITAERMIDVASGDVISPATIVVEGNRIAAVNPESTPAGAETIDLGDLTLLPGLFDMHSHVTLDFFTGDHWTTAAVKETPIVCCIFMSSMWWISGRGSALRTPAAEGSLNIAPTKEIWDPLRRILAMWIWTGKTPLV